MSTLQQLSTIYLVSPAHPLRGGIASSTERLAQALQESGYQVRIFSFSLQYPGFLFPGKTQFTSDPAPGDLEIYSLINSVNPFNWWLVGRRLRRECPDLIVVRYWLPFMGPCLGTILRLARSNGHTRVIALADNIIPHEKRPGDRLFTRYFCGAVDGFVAMSKSVLEDIAHFAHKGQPSAFVPHPLYDNYGQAVSRSEALAQLGLPDEFSYLLFFGFIRDYKGLDLLLEAMAFPKIKNKKIRLIVAGEYYGNQETYEQQIEALGIRDQLVLHTDFIPHEQVKYYFGAADLVVQPYKSATQSGISQLAYHFEKPMVVTQVGGLPEIVPHGLAGYVTEVSAPAIADAIADFFDHQRNREMTAHVVQGKKRFSWENMVSGLENIFSKIINNSKS